MPDLIEMDINQKIHQGINCLTKNKPNEAEKIFKSLLDENPINPEINHFLGISYQLQNQIDNAIIYYEKTIKMKPDFAEAHKNLGNMFYRLGVIDKAKTHLNKSIILDPSLKEAKINLEIVSEQQKIFDWALKKKKLSKGDEKKLKLDSFITERKVENGLLDQLYKLQTTELEKTKDVRFGNGKCSSDMKLFENKNEIIKTVAEDIISILKKNIGSDIYVVDSFFNILQSGSGTKPHKHLAPFDKKTGLDKQKFSLTYYISVGDQTGKEPGYLKLYDPEEEILPSNGTLVIIPSGRTHSSLYDGKKDRVMIGVNFYSSI